MPFQADALPTLSLGQSVPEPTPVRQKRASLPSMPVGAPMSPGGTTETRSEHPYAIKTTTSGLLTRSNSNPSWSPRHQSSRSLSSFPVPMESPASLGGPAAPPSPSATRPVQLRRSGTLPSFPHAPQVTMKEALPEDARLWDHEQLIRYLEEALANEHNMAKAVIKDVLQWLDRAGNGIRGSRMDGQEFMRGAWANAPTPPPFLGSLLAVSKRLRRTNLKSRILGTSREPSLPDGVTTSHGRDVSIVYEGREEIGDVFGSPDDGSDDRHVKRLVRDWEDRSSASEAGSEDDEAKVVHTGRKWSVSSSSSSVPSRSFPVTAASDTVKSFVFPLGQQLAEPTLMESNKIIEASTIEVLPSGCSSTHGRSPPPPPYDPHETSLLSPSSLPLPLSPTEPTSFHTDPSLDEDGAPPDHQAKMAVHVKSGSKPYYALRRSSSASKRPPLFLTAATPFLASAPEGSMSVSVNERPATSEDEDDDVPRRSSRRSPTSRKVTLRPHLSAAASMSSEADSVDRAILLRLTERISLLENRLADLESEWKGMPTTSEQMVPTAVPQQLVPVAAAGIPQTKMTTETSRPRAGSGKEKPPPALIRELPAFVLGVAAGLSFVVLRVVWRRSLRRS